MGQSTRPNASADLVSAHGVGGGRRGRHPLRDGPRPHLRLRLRQALARRRPELRELAASDDWYTPSHVIHGFGFYALTWLVARRLPFGTRLLLATTLEASWEVIENTSFVINRYREATIALDYYGDSILNSLSDICAMIAGFWLASRLPVAVTVAVTIALELFVGYMIHDNLTLNILMLLYPLDAVRRWQSGG